jgi:hypothetical protein
MQIATIEAATRPLGIESPAVRVFLCFVFSCTSLFCWGLPRSSFQPDNSLLVQIDAPEADVRQAVQEVSEDQTIHGTFSYEKERTLYGAHAAASAPVFGDWQEAGKPFYKLASGVLAPKFFKYSEDIGTISVRYVVQPVDASTTSLRIDAVFVDARNVKHASQGNVESAEYGAIQEHLRALQAQRKENEQAAQEIAVRRAKANPEKQNSAQPGVADSGDSWALGLTVPQLEQRVAELRHEVELQVKDSGASLKAAPFRSAGTLVSLPARTQVVVVVLTAYWYGVQTDDGRRGWIHRSQLEPVE